MGNKKENEVSGGVQPWSRLLNNLFGVLFAGLLQNGVWNDLHSSASVILIDHMMAWNYDQYLLLEVCETSISRIKYRLQKQLFFMEHCRIYGGCWGPEYMYNYFPSGGSLSLKLFGIFKLIAYRNKVCPFKATVQASDWLIKCDGHHTVGELCIRSDLFGCHQASVYICRRLQLFIVGHIKRCFFRKGFISRLSFPSRK